MLTKVSSIALFPSSLLLSDGLLSMYLIFQLGSRTSLRWVPLSHRRPVSLNLTFWLFSPFQAVQTKNPSLLLVKPEQAALVIEVIEAAIKSSKEGKRVNF